VATINCKHGVLVIKTAFLDGKRAKCEKKEKLGNLREIGEKIKVGFWQFSENP